ncbi:MAG: sensor histidine kinase N-terminal domain-containing protein [Proteobacteria bacterium]|nr:sensor histidine kinase N-terminal domain-containing protein [Pseudomonadota bacterium]MBS0493773.1 sensor histidine kinase N-terminal domain-containing protein [Pseudomonadota bacterium]
MSALPRPASLRLRLLAFLLTAIALTAAVQGVLAYRSALVEADTLFDYQMQQTAYALRAGLPPDAQASGGGKGLPEYQNDELIVQVWTNEGLRIFESAVGAALPQKAVLGFTEVQARGISYRVFSLQTRSQVIQVAQDMAVRSAMARALAWRSLLPLAVMAPLLALAVWWAVGRLLAPVERVRGQLAQRRPDDLLPVSDAGLPSELQPLVHEFNALLARVQLAFEAQQHFVADAAHELRSPLAALKLQVQGLQRAPDAAARKLAVERLASGIDRATRLVEQLLALARQEAQIASGAPPEPVPLANLARQAVLDAAPAAQQRGIDLGLAPLGAEVQGASVPGHAQALAILLRNLLDNAIKYTPQGGRVDVALLATPGYLTLQVDDSGPGIAPEERERVLQRFHRGPQPQAEGAPVAGSGLGLAIADSIARMHGSRLELGSAPELGGLRVCLRLVCTKAVG